MLLSYTNALKAITAYRTYIQYMRCHVLWRKKNVLRKWGMSECSSNGLEMFKCEVMIMSEIKLCNSVV